MCPCACAVLLFFRICVKKKQKTNKQKKCEMLSLFDMVLSLYLTSHRSVSAPVTVTVCLRECVSVSTFVLMPV